MHCPCRHPQFFLSAAQDRVPFFVVFISDLMLGWGRRLEHCDCRKQGGYALPGTWAATVTSKELFAPDPTPSWGVRWEAESSC